MIAAFLAYWSLGHHWGTAQAEPKGFWDDAIAPYQQREIDIERPTASSGEGEPGLLGHMLFMLSWPLAEPSTSRMLVMLLQRSGCRLENCDALVEHGGRTAAVPAVSLGPITRTERRPRSIGTSSTGGTQAQSGVSSMRCQMRRLTLGPPQ